METEQKKAGYNPLEDEILHPDEGPENDMPAQTGEGGVLNAESGN